MIEKFFSGSFSKAMMVSVMLLVPINAYLCYKGKSLESDLQTKRTEMALIQADNHNLANQLENAQIQVATYQKQMNDLNQKVLAKMQQAEKRSNEIIHTLEKHSAWANEPVPSDVSRLFNQRNGAISHREAHSAHLSPNKTVQQPQARDKNQR